MSDTYDLWRCDECRLVFPAREPQHTVRVQQVTERDFHTGVQRRPIEALTLCALCHRKATGRESR